MPRQTLVRPARPDDLGACARLVAAYEGGHPDEWRDRFGLTLSTADCFMSVALDGDQVVAYGRVELQSGNPMVASPVLPDGYYLAGLVVAPTHRDQGVGTAMCETRIAWVAARASDVWFFTNRRNFASRALHRKVGFSEVHEFSSPRLDGGCGVLGHQPTPRG